MRSAWAIPWKKTARTPWNDTGWTSRLPYSGTSGWVDSRKRSQAPDRVLLMPGFRELLAHVRAGGYPLGVASSTQRERMMKTLRSGLLSRLDGVLDPAEVFDVVLSGTDVGRLKPAPDIYLKAARKLNVDPERCAVIEDSEAGVRAGKAAGMTVFAVPNFFTAHQHHGDADFVLGELADLLGYL